MKKIFTLAAAVLASLGLWAQTNDHSYSFDSADELNNFIYTPGDASDEWGVKTEKSQVEPRDGGFLQYKNAKSKTTATFVTKESFNEISNISFYVASSDKGKTQIKIEISPKADFSSEVTEVVNTTSGLSDLGVASPSNNKWYPIELEVNKASGYVRFSMTAGSSGKYWSFDDLVIVSAPSCNAPENALVLKADKEVIYAGDEVTFSTEGGNGNPVTIVKDNGDVITGKWVAVEGQHKFLASQEAAGDVCAQESFLELTVITKNPVTAVTVDGPKEAYAGAELVYTATAANASQYAWSVDGVDANTNAAEFKYTAVEGEHSIVCKARNDFNAADEWIASAELKLVVTATICGELIKAELKGGNSANVTGVIGGTFDSNLSNGKYKLDKKVYIGVVLKDGATFAEGDIFNINTSAAAGQGTMAIYGDKAGTDLVYQAEEGNFGVAGNNEIELPAAANGKTALYLYRPDDGKAWNPTVAYISVTRECSKEPKLSVSPASVTLSVTDAQPQPSGKVVFSGKYLTPGTYNLDLQPIAGLSANPTSVTVDADGKLNAEVILTYENAADAEVATSQLTLTIGEKSAQVLIACSAKHGKQYMKSVNIEQWILDNGKNDAAFKDVLANANIEYLNINDLDSLNDSKDNRNEPYLGLKLKAKSAKLAGWLKKGEDAIKVKFGQVSDSLTLGINGEYRTLRKEEAAEILWLGVNPAIDRYVEIITTSNATVVIKQIMINEDIAEVVLPESATAIENTEAAAKAVKVIRDGQVLILRDGKVFNALGAEVK